MSTSAISLTINNKFSDGPSPNSAYGVSVSTSSPILTAGATGAVPLDVGSRTSEQNNGGIYQSPGGRGTIRGVTGYNLPGGEDILVVYFDNDKSLLSTVPVGSTITVDAAAGGKAKVKGTFTVAGEKSNYVASVDPLSQGDLFAVSVDLTNSL